MTDVNFPSIALCKEHGLDTGEYVRNIFNNLDFVGFKGNNLRGEFQWILHDTVMTLQNAQEYWHWLGYLHFVFAIFFVNKLTYNNYRQNIKLASSSESDRADERIERDLRGVLMSELAMGNTMSFKSEFVAKIETMFGNMIRGADNKEDLYKFFPLRINNFTLQEVEPEWIKNFQRPIIEYPNVRKGKDLLVIEPKFLMIETFNLSMGKHS